MEQEERANRYILPITEIDESMRPSECYQCNYYLRVSNAVAVLVEKYHPYYEDGRITGLCGYHAEALDLEYQGYT
jgi:hypothetical protein